MSEDYDIIGRKNSSNQTNDLDVYVITIDNYIYGYVNTKEDATKIICKIANDIKKREAVRYPTYTYYVNVLENKCEIVSTYDLWIINYDCLEYKIEYHLTKHKNI